MRISIENKKLIIKYYKSGMIINKISKKLNINHQTITYIIKKNGIFKPKGVRKYSCDFDFFKNIDTEHKAHWLGFIAADGNVMHSNKRHSLHIGLKSDDYTHLIKFKKSISANYPVLIRDYASKGKISKIARIDIHSKQITSDLCSCGIIPNKTKQLDWNTLTNNIPKNLIVHFVRGYFDGDGSWKLSKNYLTFNISSASKTPFIDNFKKWISSQIELNANKIYTRKDGYRSIEYSGRDQCIRIYNLLYSNCTIKLDRKFKKSTEHLFVVG